MSSFIHRHLGPNEDEISLMLKDLEVQSLSKWIQKIIPSEVLNVENLNLPEALGEHELIHLTRKFCAQNKTFKNYIGQGFFECLPLHVTNRNIIKNPCWYTAYTPYQAEISQGRLEVLLNFQTFVCDLTGMDLANASLLDESSAAAEAMTMAFNLSENKKTLFIDKNTWAQTKSVLKTRAESLGFYIQEGSILTDTPSSDVFAVFMGYPFADGSFTDLKTLIQKLKEKNILTLVSTDLLFNCLATPPGECGADIVIGSTGRLGLPLFFGGPHASFLATRKEFAKNIPGRIVGISKDRHKNTALRLCLQTREQHIRRERATSNICTSQVLPAILSTFYVIYHGKKGLVQIAQNIYQNTKYLYENLQKGFLITNSTFFDTLTLQFSQKEIQEIKKISLQKEINFGYSGENFLNISIGEGRTQKDMDEIIHLLSPFAKKETSPSKKALGIPFLRKSDFLTHPVFHQYQSENKLIRYIHKLQNKDLTLTHSIIPLGSCTMKLNATTQLMPLTWKGFSDIHPFAPPEQVQGSLKIFKELEEFLCEITGFSGISLQPNAGSQGEYAGLLAFKKYHEHVKEGQRNICLIPASAHGTNPASAKTAGLKVVTIKCDESGAIDFEDLKQKVITHSKKLSCLMITYPSTCGIFEKNIQKVCKLIHEHGGFVYFDGANMNALTGLCQPAKIGVDAGHLNLHKTFCIPHGGGGPGAGPLGVVEKLKSFLPSHPQISLDSPITLTSSPFGNAGVLLVPWAYIRLMGFEGLKQASQVAILNAHYIKKKLEPYYKILFTSNSQNIAHECIVDFRKFKYSANISVVDVAKRLMDYGFHSPTMSWPIPGTLMIEPTECEDKEELDRFCSALIEIRKEISEIEEGKTDKTNNLIKNAPHTLQDLISEWSFPYTKKQACYPLDNENKFWPSVSRIDEAYGDIHLFCSCPNTETIED